MEVMTRQQVFDKVAVHLIEQWARAFDDGIEKYRTRNGRTCAVGSLLVKGTYSAALEGVAVEALKVRPLSTGGQRLANALRMSGVNVDDPIVVNMLSRLQLVHDGWSPPYWPNELRSIAQMFELDPEAVDVALRKREEMYASSVYDDPD